jgi:hypothetical protein
MPDGKPGSISYSNIHGLLIEGDELWIGTFQYGIDRMSLKTEKVTKALYYRQKFIQKQFHCSPI